MAFNVDDIVRKTNGTQKYKVVTVLADSKYECKYKVGTQKVSFVFKFYTLRLRKGLSDNCKLKNYKK